jgi:CARDB protein
LGNQEKKQMARNSLFAGLVATAVIIGASSLVPSAESGDDDALAARLPVRVTEGAVRGACALPDLVAAPVDFPNGGFCRTNDAGNLVVRVRNQGVATSGASTLRVTFDVEGSGVPVEVPTPKMGSGAFTDVEIPDGFPAGCHSPEVCRFQIAVDVNDDVRPEESQDNNNVTGACGRPKEPGVAYLTVLECLIVGGRVDLATFCTSGLVCSIEHRECNPFCSTLICINELK